MIIRVLGSAAGGGFPQWNCNCDNCHSYRTGQFQGFARTQSSIAISETGEDWILINASPDIRQQLSACAGFQPARKKRDTGISAVILADAQIDHSTGLFFLREHTDPLQIYCTAAVFDDLSHGLPVLSVLNHYCGITHHTIPTEKDETFKVANFENLQFQAVPLLSNAPPYSPRRDNSVPGDNIGLFVKNLQTNKTLFYAPGIAKYDVTIHHFLSKADIIMVDGTTWTNDEMKTQGVGSKTALAMGHLPVSGDQGSMQILQQYQQARRIYIHINNTNPILNEASPAYGAVITAGIEIAYDGMEIK